MSDDCDGVSDEGAFRTHKVRFFYEGEDVGSCAVFVEDELAAVNEAVKYAPGLLRCTGDDVDVYVESPTGAMRGTVSLGVSVHLVEAADGDCDTAGDNDCDGVDAHADLWAKVRAALEAEGFDFDALVERAAETLEHWRRNPWRGDVAAAGLDGLGAGDERDDDCDGVIDDARRGVLAARAGAAALAAREAQVEPSRPEPPPVDRGVPVTPPLVEWLRGRGLEDTARLVEARDAFGREKYGQPLMSLDGRDPIEDARQELGDALQYVQRALMVGADLRPLREPLRALVGLLAKGRQSGNVGALAAVLAAPDDGRVGVPPSAPEWADLECTCRRCNPPRLMGGWLVVCATCGNKRCPHATDCRNACTGSNEPGQPGSVYGRVGGDAEMPADAVDDGRGTVTPEDDPRFVHLVLAGTATERDFEEAVDQWHMGYGDNGEELHEYLRLTRDEYAVIVTDGQRGIERVIAGRRADAQGAT